MRDSKIILVLGAMGMACGLNGCTPFPGGAAGGGPGTALGTVAQAAALGADVAGGSTGSLLDTVASATRLTNNVLVR